jgi:hypothetical protein
MSKKVKIFAIVVILIAIVVLGATFMPSQAPSSSTASLGSSADIRPQTSAPSVGDNEFSVLLSSINSINIDTSIFSNPAYKALRDYPVNLGSDTVGRTNPFAPIGTDIASSGDMPTVQTLQPGKITSTSAEFGAQITLQDTVPVTLIFNYGTSDAFGSATAPITVSKSGAALVTVTGLSPATSYIVKPVIVRGSNTVEGGIAPFNTLTAPIRR